MIFEALFIAANSVGNKIRGGLLAHIWGENVWSGQAQRGIGLAIMYLSLFLCVGLVWYNAAIVAIAWMLFLLPPWGAWFDMGQLPPMPERGGILSPIYNWLNANVANQTTVDCIMMFLRGSYSVVLFAGIYLVTWNPWVFALTPMLALWWMFAYLLDRHMIQPFYNFAEYYAGAVMAIFILIGLSL